MFKVYTDRIKNFKGQYILVTLLSEVSRACISDTQPNIPSRRFDKFPKFWCLKHFLVGLETYIYLPNEMFQKETYLKNKLANFQIGLGFVNGVKCFVATSKKQKKQYIDMCQLVDSSQTKV